MRNRVRAGWNVLWLTLVVVLISPPMMKDKARATDADKEKIAAAIKKGVAFLSKASWDYLDVAKPAPAGQRDQYDVGVAALAGLALLESEVNRSDASVRRALVTVRNYSGNLNQTYPLSLSIMFLSRYGSAEDAGLIRKLTLRLLAGQTANGGWSYLCPLLTTQQETATLRFFAEREKRDKVDEGEGQGGGPGAVGLGPDNSNTQFAILALWMGRKQKIPVQYALLRTEVRFRGTQNGDGGWSYGVGPMQSSAGMTCAGLLALAVGHGNTQERQATLKAVGNPDQPPADAKDAPPAGGGEAARFTIDKLSEDRQVLAARDFLVARMRDGVIEHYLYFLWSLERVCVVYGWDEENWCDWYAWGADVLLKSQMADGGWKYEYGRSVDTAFALLFLRKANLLEEFKKAKFVAVAKKDQPILAQPGGPPADGGAVRQPKDDLPDDAKVLGKELITSSGPRRAAIIKKLSEGKGLDYQTTLATSIPQLSGPDRQAARDALAKRLESAGLEDLVKHLEGRDQELQRAAARAAVAKKGKDPGRLLPPPLIALLDNFEDDIQDAAYNALKVLTNQDLGRRPGPWKNWWRERTGKILP